MATLPRNPFYPKLYETVEEVPSYPQWVAFVRHAQAGHNVDRALIEKPDNPLTEVGVAQALKARESKRLSEGLQLADYVWRQKELRSVQQSSTCIRNCSNMNSSEELERVRAMRGEGGACRCCSSRSGARGDQPAETGLADSGPSFGWVRRSAWESTCQADLCLRNDITKPLLSDGRISAPVPGHAEVDSGISERWSAPCDEGTAKSELVT